MDTWQARLLNATELSLSLPQALSQGQLHSIRLQINFQELVSLILLKEEKKQGMFVYTFAYASAFHLGQAYYLVVEGVATFAVHVEALMHEPHFHAQHDASKETLGNQYLTTHTMFQVWAPLASDVQLVFYSPQGEKLQVYPMLRKPNGVYHLNLAGNHEGQRYRYGVINHGVYQETIDPYSIGLSRNSVYSVVLNPQSLQQAMHDDKLPPFQDYQDAIIYEAHVRDLSSDPAVRFEHPRSFLGAIQSGLTLGQTAVGFDYIRKLGITHLQLLPINDFRSVNEFNILQSYNWGYDPYQYFALEGSFATQLDDPASRIRDFKTLVAAYHQVGIRINIDVVFNHVYDYQHSPLEILVPGYYFRKLPNGQMSNGSFCGNDLASEKIMVRHLIVQAATHLVSMYHVDGFRFDLMGILDLETLNAIQTNVRAIKPDFMLYGEGWNMPTHLPMPQKGITENSDKLPAFAFFNDTFRNTIKGGNSEHDATVPGYATGNPEASNALPYLFFGSANPVLGQPKVQAMHQSINYVECHDNNTFYDKLTVCQPHEGDTFHFRRLILANSLILFSAGIPFFHMAQEVGGTKRGDHNSFQSGDAINQFQYQWVVDRAWLVKAFQDLIQLRKWFRQHHTKLWQPEFVHFTMLDHHTTHLTFKDGQQTYHFLWNPSLHQVMLPSSLLATTMIFDGEKRVDSSNTLTHIPPLRFLLLKQN